MGCPVFPMHSYAERVDLSAFLSDILSDTLADTLADILSDTLALALVTDER